MKRFKVSHESFVVVTGALGGIGRAVCARLQHGGFKVLGVDNKNHDDFAGVDEYLPVDVSSFAQSDDAIGRFIELTRGVIGSSRLAGLVNNAALQVLGRVSACSRESWCQTLDTNLSAPFLLSKALYRTLRTGDGCIVNISSVHARATKPGFIAYSTSKAALSGLTRGLAIDFGYAVPVFGIEPGAVETPMLRAGFEGDPDGWSQLNRYQPLGRIARAEEIADLVHYLISNRPLLLSGAMLEAGGAIGSRLHDPA